MRLNSFMVDAQEALVGQRAHDAVQCGLRQVDVRRQVSQARPAAPVADLAQDRGGPLDDLEPAVAATGRAVGVDVGLWSGTR